MDETTVTNTASETPVTPAAPEANTPATATVPTVTPTASAQPTIEPTAAIDANVTKDDAILQAIADDLKPIIDDKPVENQPVDLAVKYKDDPAVLALIEEQKTYAPISDALKTNQYPIASADELKAQLSDSNALYDIMAGKKSSADLLDVMLKNPDWPEAAKQKAVNDLVQYIGKLTGQPIAAAAAGEIKDPAMLRIETLEAAIKADKDAKELAVFTNRVNTAKASIHGKVSEFLKGTFLDGDADYVMNQLGSQFTQDKVMGIVEAAERGDFTQIQKAIQKIKNTEAIRFKSYYDRIVAAKTKIANTIPKQVSGGAAPAPAVENTNVVELDSDKRRAKMLAEFRSQG